MSGSLLTADQVAQMLGVPKSWVYEQSRNGRIPTVTLGRSTDGRSAREADEMLGEIIDEAYRDAFGDRRR